MTLSARRRRFSGRPPTVGIVVVLVVLVAGGAWLWLRSRDAGPPPGGEPGVADTPAASAAPSDSPLDLPGLDASDELVRRMAAGLSSHPRGTAELYRRLRPLFEEAYRDLGFRQGSFDGALARAVESLLAVSVPDGPIEVVPAGANAYEYRDPELEELSPARKHLLRMGPENARRVQAKLRELAEALELPMLTARGG